MEPTLISWGSIYPQDPLEFVGLEVLLCHYGPSRASALLELCPA